MSFCEKLRRLRKKLKMQKAANTCKHRNPTKTIAPEGTYYYCPQCRTRWFANKKK